MNGYALAAVAMLCVTACVVFALWRFYQEHDRTKAKQDHECEARALRALYNQADRLREDITAAEQRVKLREANVTAMDRGFSATVKDVEAGIAKLRADVDEHDRVIKARAWGGRS